MNRKVKYLALSLAGFAVLGVIIGTISLTPYTWERLDLSSAVQKFGAPLPTSGSGFAVLVHPRQRIATCEIKSTDFVAWAALHNLELIPLSSSTLRVFREATTLSDSRLIDSGYFAELNSVTIVFDDRTGRASFSREH